MSEGPVEFQKVPIRPLDCFREAIDLLREQYWLFVGICAVGILIGSAVPLGIVLGPMMCGIYLCYFRRLRGGNVTFDLLFKGFDYFMESLIATLIMMAATMVIMIPLSLVSFVVFVALGASAGPASGETVFVKFFAIFAVVYFVILMVSLLVGTFFVFAYPLIVDRGLKAVPAIQTSFRAVLANLGGMLGLVFLSALLGLAASCCCYFPAFLVMPISFGAITLAYRKVFPEMYQGQNNV